MRRTIVIASAAVLWASMAGAATPEQKCQGGKNRVAGKYAACRQNAEKGLALTGTEVARAEALRIEAFLRMTAFMERYEFLALPVNQVTPFSIDTPYPQEIAGVRMETYIDWMKSCYFITVTGHPAISVPCGFTAEGLPVGVQIAGRYRDELGVLQLAHAFESATGHWKRRPPAAQ